ncbi:MAG: helix-turn-helix transcriptional regulator [Bacteroidia bacterium]|nr:helix-turn-helix transcriptional regulator [Bacteroidia bacterium]
MFKKEELIKYPDYWLEGIQNELFRQLHAYMESEGLNQTQLAARLGVSKGYISQILNGNFNFTIKKLVELLLAIGKVPEFRVLSVNEFLLGRNSETITIRKATEMLTSIPIQSKNNTGRTIHMSTVYSQSNRVSEPELLEYGAEQIKHYA